MNYGASSWWILPKTALVGIAAALMAGCAITPKAGPTCGFASYKLVTKTPKARDDTHEVVPEQSKADASEGGRTELFKALEPGARTPRGLSLDGRPVDGSMLFLSGGSQHGAFGAGYLDKWAELRPGGLPKFWFVTGVSTGALISTFAFINKPEIAAREYSIKDESRLLERLVPMRHGSPTNWGYVQVIRKGAVADLAPLRRRLHTLITEDVLREVARGADEGRHLLVGVVDVDTGDAIALDMTGMAKKWRKAEDASKRLEASTFKDCYIEAVIASSSAPIAALPVFIDHRMYIDGGVRFGAFSDELGPILGSRLPPLAPSQEKPRIYLLVNGYQKTWSKCGRQNETKCGTDGSDYEGTDEPHGKWKFLQLALRTEDILANQVYRFSAESIANQAKAREADLTYAQIGEEALDHSYTEPGENHQTTCREARETDRFERDPVQFFPRYMRCIIDYGEQKAIEARAAGKLP